MEAGAFPELKSDGGVSRLEKSDRMVLAFVAIFICVAIVCNFKSQLIWAPSIWTVLWVPASLACILAFYLLRRPNERKPIELTLYAGLWLVYPLFGTQLTYIANTWNFPLQDDFFNALDTSIGFNWSAYAGVQDRMPWLHAVAFLTYATSYIQPFISVCIIAFTGRRGKNATLVIANLFALLVTLVVSGLVPSTGPMELHHLANPWSPVTYALRAGEHGPLPYVGIITFPSFHAVMAVQFTLIHLGNRPVFYAFAVLNTMMLATLPYPGGHYLIDVFAGAIIGLAAYWTAQKILTAAHRNSC